MFSSSDDYFILHKKKKSIKPLGVSKICVECQRKVKGSALVLRSRIYHSLSLTLDMQHIFALKLIKFQHL